MPPMTPSALAHFPGAPARAAATRAARSLPRAFAFALAWGPVLAALGAAGMIGAEQAAGGRFATVVLVFLGAGVAAGAPAWLLAAALAGHRPATARAAAMLVLLTVGTAGAIALFQYVAYATMDIETHPDIVFPSLHWVLSQITGMAMGAYVTVAAGLRLILPEGLVALFAAAAAFARYGRPTPG